MRVLDLFCCEGGASEGYRLCGMRVVGIDSGQAHIDRYNSHFSEWRKGRARDMQGYVYDWREGLARAQREEFGRIDFVHASPPCQLFSSQTRDKERAAQRYFHNIIPRVRRELDAWGIPYVIENVVMARPVLTGRVVTLSARMFPGELEVDWDVRSTAPDYASKIEKESAGGVWFKGPVCTAEGCQCKGRGHPAYWQNVVPEDEVPTRWTLERKRLFEYRGFELRQPVEHPTDREVMTITQSNNPTHLWNKVNRHGVPRKVRQEIMGGLDWMSDSGIGEAIPPCYTRHIGECVQASCAV